MPSELYDCCGCQGRAVNLTGLGIWTAQFDFHPAAVVRDTVQELESLGYGSLWVGENVGREPISQSAILLGATRRMLIATAVANIWARDPMSATTAHHTLSEAYPERFRFRPNTPPPPGKSSGRANFSYRNRPSSSTPTVTAPATSLANTSAGTCRCATTPTTCAGSASERRTSNTTAATG